MEIKESKNGNFRVSVGTYENELDALIMKVSVEDTGHEAWIKTPYTDAEKNYWRETSNDKSSNTEKKNDKL